MNLVPVLPQDLRSSASPSFVDVTLTNDLLLASGSILNWNSGDILLTHTANTLTFSGMSSLDFGASALTTTGKITGNEYLITKPSTGYILTGRSDTLAIRNETQGSYTAVGIYSKDGDGTDTIDFILYGVGTTSSVTTRERLIIRHNQSSFGTVDIYTEQANSTLRPLRLFTGANVNQLLLNTDGTITMATGKLTVSTGGVTVNGGNVGVYSGYVDAAGFYVNGVQGWTGTFTNGDGNMVTVNNGIITDVS